MSVMAWHRQCSFLESFSGLPKFRLKLIFWHPLHDQIPLSGISRNDLSSHVWFRGIAEYHRQNPVWDCISSWLPARCSTPKHYLRQSAWIGQNVASSRISDRVLSWTGCCCDRHGSGWQPDSSHTFVLSLRECTIRSDHYLSCIWQKQHQYAFCFNSWTAGYGFLGYCSLLYMPKSIFAILCTFRKFARQCSTQLYQGHL